MRQTEVPPGQKRGGGVSGFLEKIVQVGLPVVLALVVLVVLIAIMDRRPSKAKRHRAHDSDARRREMNRP